MKLSPSEFWGLSLSEWRWLVAPSTEASMTRDDLAALLCQFPDEKS